MREGACWHGDMGTRGDTALGVFLVPGSLFFVRCFLQRSQGKDGGAARWKRLAVSGWEYREAARAARGAAPTLETGGRVADASLPYAFLT